MKSNYYNIPKKYIAKEDWNDGDYTGMYSDNPKDSIYREEDKNDFHIGQSYESEPAKTIICNECNGDKFIVGRGNYFTAIKCIGCGWEMCVHEG